MRTLYLLIFAGMCFGPMLMAQEAVQGRTGSINGIILDDKSGAPLAGVNVTIEGTRPGGSTDENGVFEIKNLAPGNYTLIFEFVGYEKSIRRNVSVSAGGSSDLSTIRLKAATLRLKEIVVSPGSYSMMGNDPSIRQTLSSDDIEIMGWAEDITRAVQRIPGITANEFSAKFSVRGGEADEVLVLLDGMQIYKPFHQKDFGGGLFSTVDIEAIEGVNLLTGGFSAEYGDRMSGVLDMRTKSPQNGQRQSSVGFSLMNLRMFSMGSFNDNKGSYLLSARRGYLDIIDRLMGNEFKLKPNYYDVLSKLEFKLSDSQTLAAYGFFANDAYKLDERVIERGKSVPNIDYVDTNYGNNYGWLTLKSVFSPQLYARTIVYGGAVDQKRFWENFDDDPDAYMRSADILDERKFRFAGIKQDWDVELSDDVLLKAGADLKRMRTDYDYFNDINNEFIDRDGNLVPQVKSLPLPRVMKATRPGCICRRAFAWRSRWR